MRRIRSFDLYYFAAYVVSIVLCFMPLVDEAESFVFYISLGIGLFATIVSLACAIIIAPLRDFWLYFKLVLCMAAFLVGIMVMSPIQVISFGPPLWIAIAGFVVSGYKMGLKAIPHYVITIAAFVLMFFPELRWIGFAAFSLDSFVYLFFNEHTSERFACLYIACFGAYLSVFYASIDFGAPFGLFIAIVSLAYGYLRPQIQTIFRVRHENEIQRQREIRLAEIEEKALRAEIRPHFILNVLNNVQVAYHENPDEGKRLLEKLINMIRQLSRVGSLKTIPLSAEVRIVETLIELYDIERKSNVVFETDIEDETLEIPPLLLEPLVENSLNHSGITSRPDGKVFIIHRRFFGLETIIVGDNGSGIAKDRLMKGIGSSNVFRRVGLLPEGKIELESAPDGGALIHISFRQEE